MHGKLKVDKCQPLINHFKNANNKAKVLLTSTRASGKWINLVNTFGSLNVLLKYLINV
jgi:DNA repair and recombination RAD54-like protein